MGKWIEVLSNAGSMADGEHLALSLDYEDVAVFRADGQFYAISNACSHDGNEIASGCVNGTEITCPRHSARFCLKTGKVLSPPAYEDLTTYPVRVVDGRLEVFVDSDA